MTQIFASRSGITKYTHILPLCNLHHNCTDMKNTSSARRFTKKKLQQQNKKKEIKEARRVYAVQAQREPCARVPCVYTHAGPGDLCDMHID